MDSLDNVATIKIIILWALILSFCVAYAQGPGSFYPCPSSLDFQCSYVTFLPRLFLGKPV